MTIPLEVWNWGISDKWFTGALAGAGRDYYERLLTLIEYGKLDPSPLVTHVLQGWDSVDEGLDLMREPRRERHQARDGRELTSRRKTARRDSAQGVDSR